MRGVCSICLERVGKKKKFVTSCNHRFHSKCLLIWVIGNDTCPVCRKNLKEQEGDTEAVELMEEEELRNLREIFYIITEIIIMREG